MAFELEIGFHSHHTYLHDYLVSFFESHNVEAIVEQSRDSVIVTVDEQNPKLEAALTALNDTMPYSLFMGEVSHRFCEAPFIPEDTNRHAPLPVSLGVCERCKTEMLDPKSRRYYYPLTSCRHCGPQYAFFEHYPYMRANTALRDLEPCAACEKESETNPFRMHYAQNGCHTCGVALKLVSGAGTMEATDGEGCKSIFEKAAQLLKEGKTVRVKTGFGWRRFTPLAPEYVTPKSVMMHINGRTLMDDLSLTRQEIESLYSLEKPLLKVATQSHGMKTLFGTTVQCKVPDEGFSLLLAHELEALGIDVLLFEACSEETPADASLSHPLPQQEQSEMTLFVTGTHRYIKSGERVTFPARLAARNETLCVTPSLVAVPTPDGHIIDRMDHFEGATATKMTLLEGTQSDIAHTNTKPFTAAEGAFMGVLAANRLEGHAVGLYFEGNNVSFLYHNGKQVTTVVPPHVFEPESLIRRIETLREGTERLLERIESEHPHLFALLHRIEDEKWELFDAAAAVAGAERGGFEALDDAALGFMGKGGTQVDMRFEESRFNPYAMLASLLSYRLAGVEPVMLSYSLFESFADYAADILTELQIKTSAAHIVLCGSQVAQVSLFSRLVEKLKVHPPQLSRSFPVGSDASVVGGIYL